MRWQATSAASVRGGGEDVWSTCSGRAGVVELGWSGRVDGVVEAWSSGLQAVGLLISDVCLDWATDCGSCWLPVADTVASLTVPTASSSLKSHMAPYMPLSFRRLASGRSKGPTDVSWVSSCVSGSCRHCPISFSVVVSVDSSDTHDADKERLIG